ncbi:MAG: N-acetyl-gamma-glutamyl-phosphate reductase, partial [Planctomycetales bacterium 12-60-4]
MTRVAILGATGYTALELIRILLDHPHADVTTLTSRQEGSPHIHSVHPSLYGRLDVKCEDLPPSAVAERADVVFGCLPHGASMAAVPELLERGCKVVDLSADYRLNDPDVYAEWYGLTHTDPERTKHSIYGLPELFAEKIRGASFIANPGCYTSTSILALAPLLVNGLAEPTGIIIDAKSGVSGAGRS